jgi:hypothetical protein
MRCVDRIVRMLFGLALVAGATALWAGAAYGVTPPAAPIAAAQSAATDGISVGQDFDIPVMVAGRVSHGKALVTVDHPGCNVLRVYYVSDGKVAGPLLYDLVRRGDTTPQPQPQPGPGPSPNPPPQPGPQPGPQPAPKVAMFYLIHETADASPALAAVRNNAAWKSDAEKRGIKWLIFDKDTGTTKFAAATRRAVACGLPAVVVIDQAGGCRVEPCPTSPEAMLTLIRKAGAAP